jgi:head-tail adaptor
MKSSGQRRSWVTLEEEVEVTDALGGRTQTWEPYATVRGAIESKLSGSSEAEAVVLYMVTIPYRADTIAKHFDGQQQHVVTVDKTLKVLEMASPEERNRELVLHCARVTA